MKRKVQFGEDTCFDVPIRRAIRPRARLWRDILLPLRVLARTKRSKLITRRFD